MALKPYPNLNDTRKRIDMTIEKFGGYVSKENAYSYEERIEQSIVIRVPAENFDRLTAEISTYAKKLDRKHIEARMTFWPGTFFYASVVVVNVI